MLERKSKDQRGKTEKEKEIPIKYHRPLAAYRSHTISGRGGAPRSRAEAFSNSSKVQHCCTTAKKPTKLEVWTREERTEQCLTTWLHTACLSLGYIWCEADCRAYLFTGQFWGLTGVLLHPVFKGDFVTFGSCAGVFVNMNCIMFVCQASISNGYLPVDGKSAAF